MAHVLVLKLCGRCYLVTADAVYQGKGTGMHSPLVFDKYVAPARLRPQVWRLVLGIALAILVYLAWMAAMGVALWLVLGLDELEAAMNSVGLGRTPWSLLGLLFTFVGMALGAFAAVHWVHKRSIASLFGPRALVLRDFAAGVGLFMLVTIPSALIVLALVDVTPGVAWSTWLVFLPLALLGLLIQTGAEEILFRGYLQQQLAARFLTRWVWMVLPSILFGLVHYAPAEMGDSAWLLVFATGFFGLLLADLTARSGSIGLAWGLHFANNFVAMLIFTTGEALDGLAPFRLPFGPQDGGIMGWMVLMDIAGMVLVYFLCRRMLRGR